MATALELLLSVGPAEPGTKIGITDGAGHEWTVEFGEIIPPAVS